MKEYIRNVIKVFEKTTVIVTINDELQEEVLDFGFPINTIYVTNKGMDIYPFLEGIKYIKSKKIPCDYLLKLHTKKTSEFGLYNWRNRLIFPLTNYSHLRILHLYMELYKDQIGLISAQECIYNKDYYQNSEKISNSLSDILKLFPHLPRDYNTFNRGNMFWINYNLIEKYMSDDIIEYISNNCTNGVPKGKESIEYVCERLFSGFLPYKCLNILVNSNFINSQRFNYNLDQRVFSIDRGYINNDFLNGIFN